LLLRFLRLRFRLFSFGLLNSKFGLLLLRFLHIRIGLFSCRLLNFTSRLGGCGLFYAAIVYGTYGVVALAFAGTVITISATFKPFSLGS
jgi:hypothetical protein